MSRSFLDTTEPFQTEVTALWFRAPELLLDHQYDASIDMWSVGCIIAYMIRGNHLWTGRNNRDQLDLILSHRGATKRMMQYDQYYAQYSRKRCLREELSSFEDPNGKSFHLGADLVERLLQLVPSDRLTAEAALDHPFTYEYRNLLNDSKSDRFFEFQWQHDIKTIDDARSCAYNLIMKTVKPLNESMAYRAVNVMEESL